MTTLLILALSAMAADTPTDDSESSSGSDSSSSGDGIAWIINGEDATAEDYPMAGGMLFDADLGPSSYYKTPMLMCSSTLIAPDVVLLAAHCVDMVIYESYFPGLTDEQFAWSRTADLSAYDGSRALDMPEDTVMAVGFVLHEDYDIYDYGIGLTRNEDIALLFLAEPVLDVPYAYPPSPDEADQVVVDKDVVVVGWGQQTDDSYPPAGTYAIKQMGVSHIAETAEFEMKIGEAREDTRKCHGDSGGPSFMDVDASTSEKMRVVGVTSHAYDNTDCRRTGGVDTRVDAYLDWIDGQMRDACADGTRVWCDYEGIIYADTDLGGDSGDDTGSSADDTGQWWDDTGDTRPPDDDDDDDDGDVSACGCASAGAGARPWTPLSWTLLLVPLLVRRRR